MGHVVVKQFDGTSRARQPALFSTTSNFAFLGRNGSLRHEYLPNGPKAFTVVRVRSTGHVADFVEHSRTAITLPISGRAEVRTLNRTHDVAPGQAFFIGPSSRASRLLPGAEDQCYRSITILTPEAWPFGFTMVERAGISDDRHQVSILRQFLLLGLEMFAGADSDLPRRLVLFEAMLEDLVWHVLQVSSGGPDCQGSVRRVLLDAQEFMRGRAAEPISMLDVARFAGVSPRYLQKVFAARLGLSPRQFLTELRLTRMRELLTDVGREMSVTAAALDAGLFHLGRASGLYRRRFGERPSETIRRCR